MYTTLETIKNHLHIDLDYTGDDTYLLYLYTVAEATVQREICQMVEDLEDTEHNIPAPLVHAMLLYIGDLYNSREGNAYGVNVSTVPFSYQYLTDLYHNYADTYTEEFVNECLKDILSRMYIDEQGRLIIRSTPDMYQGARGRALKRIEDNFIIHNGNLVNLQVI